MEQLKKEIIRFILTDNLEQASNLFSQHNNPELKDLAKLLDKIPSQSLPLAEWKSFSAESMLRPGLTRRSPATQSIWSFAARGK